MNDEQFLQIVYEYCKERPEVVPHMNQRITQAIQDRMSSETEKRARVETALVTALMRRSRTADKTLASVLNDISKWSMYSYDSVIKELGHD